MLDANAMVTLIGINVVLMLISFISLIVLFFATRLGFQTVSSTLNALHRKVDDADRENMVRRRVHAQKLEELENEVIKMKNKTTSSKAKAKATSRSRK